MLHTGFKTGAWASWAGKILPAECKRWGSPGFFVKEQEDVSPCPIPQMDGATGASQPSKISPDSAAVRPRAEGTDVNPACGQTMLPLVPAPSFSPQCL